ncbi:MAG: NDP-sugar synthase [Candidatus Rokubacteria bacterium]|nr:NDP-sugar synthase [Candidatus Rokubacteria bacterium]
MRMMPLTATLPKAMAPYKGSTLIAQGIAKMAKRIANIHVTVGYKGPVLAQHVIEQGASSVFTTEGRSNAWWIYHTLLRHLDEPIYVLTCDNVVELDFDLLETNYRKLDSPACMLVPVRPVAGLEGDYIFHENQRVTEVDRHKPSDIYCSGIQILNPSRLNAATRDDGDFYAVWSQLIAQGQLFVSSVYPKEWCVVDTLEQLVRLNEE